MRLIQKYLPNSRHTEVHRIFVKAKPNEACEIMRHLDMAKVPWIKLLFSIRTLPDRLKGISKEADKKIGIDQIAENGKGFFIAEEIPGKEVVVAAIGKFWYLNIPFVDVTSDEF